MINPYLKRKTHIKGLREREEKLGFITAPPPPVSAYCCCRILFTNNTPQPCQIKKLRTRVIQKNCNPVWNDVLSISLTDINMPIKLTVFDKDTFTKDDKMGDATIDIRPYLECLQMGLGELPIGTAVKKIQPDVLNCLADESKVVWVGKGKMVQDMILKLQNVDKGKVQIQLEWLDLPGCRGLRT